MNESVRQYWERTLQYWNAFNKTQKIMFISVLVFVFLTFTLLIYYFSKTEYSLAYKDLSANDAAIIRDYLNESGIPYKFTANGTAVGVPTKYVTDVKLDVESQNMLHGGSIGYGIFRDNMSSLGMTDNQFDVLYADAKAGEIEQLIKSMEGVNGAKVLLTMPKQSVFLSADGPELASASVVVSFRPGFQVTQPYIDTIYNLVSKSVTNLPVENIKIADNITGEMLPSSKDSLGIHNSTGVAATQFQIKKQYEIDIQNNIESFLGKIFGPEKVIANVVANLNFDQKNTHEVLFQPVNEQNQSGIERSVQEIQKLYTSEGAGSASVPGTTEGDTNTWYPGVGDGGNSVNSEEMERIINYEVNEITNTIISSPFVVEDLAISVGIEPYVPDDPTSLTEDAKEEIREMIVNIVGTSLATSGKQFQVEDFNQKVSVIAHPFYGKREIEVDNLSTTYAMYGLIALAALLAAGAGYYIAQTRRRKAQQAEEELLAAAANEQLEATIDLDAASPEHQVRNQLESLAKKKPEEFVNLLRTWLIEE